MKHEVQRVFSITRWQLSDNHELTIGMLITYANFSNDKSEIFGFWYFKEMGLPATRDDKRAFFHDLMTDRCCQLSLKGNQSQIRQLIEVMGEAAHKLPSDYLLQEGISQYGSIRVTFDDLGEPQGTSLAVNLPVRVTDPFETVIQKVKNRGDVVELNLESDWNLATELLGYMPKNSEQCNSAVTEDRDDFEDYQDDSEDDTVFPLTESDIEFVTCDVINFTRKLIERSRPTPKQLIGLAHALYALERLPEITPGVSVEYGLQLRKGDEELAEFKYWSISINEETFEVSSSGSIYNRSVGSDSYTGFKLYVEAGSHGYRECNDDNYDWIESTVEVLNLGGRLDVTDDSEPDCIQNAEE